MTVHSDTNPSELNLAAPAGDAIPAPIPVLVPLPAETNRWWQSPGLRIAVLSVGAVALAAASMYFFRGRLKPVIAPPVAAHTQLRRSVAVIGLRNLSGAPEDKWLSTALAEMLSTELSASDQLRVISGEEVARAGLTEPPANTPSHETLARYGNQLGVDMILVGSYAVTREAGSSAPKMRLDLRLENVTSDAPPVTLVETGGATDLFTLVSASGKQLRQQFGFGEVAPENANAVRRTLPTNPAAARYFAEGLTRLRDFDPVGARDLLEKAIQIDPIHAGTHQALSEAWHAMGYEPEALAEAARAVELGTGLPRQELLSMQGDLALWRGDGEGAATIFRSLLTFYPDNVSYAIYLEQAQIDESKFQDAVATLESMRQKGISRADEARIDLAEALAHLQKSDFHEAVANANQAIQSGADLGSNSIRAQGLWIKASALERLGDSQGSLATSAESQNLYRSLGDKRGLGLASLINGDVLYDQGKQEEARKLFIETLDSFRQIGHRRNMGVVEERLGNTYLAQGELGESRKYYQQALDNYREIHWDAGIASAVGNIASVQDAEGNIAGSLESNRQGLDLFEKSGDKRGVATTLANMGNLELERGALDQASSDYQRAAEIDRQISYVSGLTYALTGQGDVLTLRNDLPGAMRQYDLALKSLGTRDEPDALAPLKTSIGIAKLYIGNADQAATALQQAVDIAKKDQNHTAATAALAWLSRAQLAQGRIADALATANRAVAESRQQSGPQMRLVAALALSTVQLALGTFAAAREQAKSVVQGAQNYGYARLNLEARINLSRTEPAAAERRRQLGSLASEAERKGWKQLAAEARSAHGS